MSAIAAKLSPPDPTFYPVDDDMAEGLLHREIADMLRFLLQRFLMRSSVVARVGANQFIYWVPMNPKMTVAPDVYVLPGVPPETTFGNWKVWETGICPSFALEIVSQAIHKDYVEVIERYDDLGVPEVVIFDPRAGRPRSKRIRWQVYRRLKGHGLCRVESSNEDRVVSKVLGCWLRMVGHGPSTRVRIATGADGDDLFPSAEEAAAAMAYAEAARAQNAAAQARSAAARAEEAETKASEAEARAAAAESELARLRRKLERESAKKPRRR